MYLQPERCSVDVAHHARHLLSFPNFAWILDADDEHTHYWISGSQLFLSGLDKSCTVSENMKVCFTPPGPEAPGLR